MSLTRNNVKQYFLIRDYSCKTSRRMQRSSRTETNDEGGIAGSCRPDLLSVIQNGAADQMIFQNGDEVIFDSHITFMQSGIVIIHEFI